MNPFISGLIVGGASAGSSNTLASFIAEQGLTANTVLCVDFNDTSSYSGSGQTLTDVIAGNSLYFGADGSSAADDPTYNAGPPPYASVDGGDFWRLVAASNPAAFENFHKDNATWGGLIAFYGPTAYGTNVLCGTRGSAFANGFEVRVDSGSMRLGVDNGGGSFNVLDKTGGTSLTTSAWQVIGWSINEPVGSGGGFLWRNGAYNQVAASNTFDATYASPSAGSAGYKIDVFASGNGVAKMASGARLNCMALFNTAPSKTQLDGIFGASAGQNLRGILGI